MKKTIEHLHLTRRTALFAMAGSVAHLAGCGGGGLDIAGISSGGTGSFTSGSISGLGSIIVNGIRYDDSSASVSGSVDSASALRPGMVVTLEPGLYVRPAADVPEAFWNIGIRIEDDAVVTDSGCELISRGVPVAADEIEAWMRG